MSLQHALEILKKNATDRFKQLHSLSSIKIQEYWSIALDIKKPALQRKLFSYQAIARLVESPEL